jgi:hypothetical protein
MGLSMKSWFTDLNLFEWGETELCLNLLMKKDS